MTPSELRERIRPLKESGAVTEAFERELWFGDGPRTTWYRSQREHWLGWLAEYDGPGFYGRTNSNRDAKFIYNHINCAPMLLWLCEALGGDEARLLEAKAAVLVAGSNEAQRAAALRRVLPWAEVETLLEAATCRRSIRELGSSLISRLTRQRDTG